MTFHGSGQTLSGSTLFENITKVTGNDDTFWLDYTAQQSVSGTLTLRGNAVGLLELRSTKTGSASNLLLDSGDGVQVIDYVDVQDNDASGGQTLVCRATEEGCVDSGNNTNWEFGDRVWDGGGTDGNCSTAENWNPDPET